MYFTGLAGTEMGVGAGIGVAPNLGNIRQFLESFPGESR
jgi:ABC-type lipoprotein release transport system permease subunit